MNASVLEVHNPDLDLQFFAPFLATEPNEHKYCDILHAESNEEMTALAKDMGLPLPLLKTMAGLLRWALGSRLGFLNHVSGEGDYQEMVRSVVLQTAGDFGRRYDTQNPQSHLLWYFFSLPFSRSCWKEGRGLVPLNLSISNSDPVLRNVNSTRSEALSKAFASAREELGLSEEESGRLLRIAQFEWLCYLTPAKPTTDEEIACKLIMRIRESTFY